MNYEDNSRSYELTAISLAAAIVGVFIGFLIGWFANESDTSRVYCTFVAILLIIAMKYGVRGYQQAMIVQSELVRKHREDDEKLAAKHEKLALTQIKAMREATKSEIAVQKSREVKEPKASKVKYDFTNKDFDDSAQALLTPIVKKAKGKKVTAEGLIKTILKGFK